MEVKVVKRILLKLIPNKILKQLRNFYILAVKYSQYKTIKLYSCVDKNGKEIPISCYRIFM